MTRRTERNHIIDALARVIAGNNRWNVADLPDHVDWYDLGDGSYIRSELARIPDTWITAAQRRARKNPEYDIDGGN
jgi:hypothetical protein